MSRQGVRGEISFYVWSVVPILASSAATVLGIWAALDPALAAGIRLTAILLAIGTCGFLIAKARRDRKLERTANEIRYDALDALRHKIAPALRSTAQLTLIAPAEHGARSEALRSIAQAYASAAVSLMPKDVGARAVVFKVQDKGDIESIGVFGRSDFPRTFTRGAADTEEILEFIRSQPMDTDGFYDDVTVMSPKHWTGDPRRYSTFLRAPIMDGRVAYGMLTIDARKPGSLSKGDHDLAKLIAAELALAFAAAAATE